jgi:hypothetical protein
LKKRSALFSGKHAPFGMLSSDNVPIGPFEGSGAEEKKIFPFPHPK